MPASRFCAALAGASCLGLAFGVVGARPAAADTTAVTLSGTGLENSPAQFGSESYTLGYTFTVNDPITVTQLGWAYDPGFTLQTSAVPASSAVTPKISGNPVGLYDTAGDLLTSATVAYDGSSGIGFSYASITPYALNSGQTYVLAGVAGPADPFLYSYTATTAPDITYGADRIYDGGQNMTTLANFPTASDSASGVDPAYFGPNFRFTPNATAVPEPAPVALLSLGLLALGGPLLRSRRRVG